METFPWTRIPGVDVPNGHKSPVDLSGRDDISLSGFREVIGDGSFGGWYERSEAEMSNIWEIAVRETQARLTDGWTS